MAGESLPPLHTQNVQQEFYVDAVGGNDTTGDGSSGNPWQTVQKAADYLRTIASWTGLGDVVVYLNPGTYKAASSQAYTLDLSFTAGARSPNSSRWLIFKPAPGAEGNVIVSNPDGATGSKGAIRVGATSGNNYICFDGLDVDGEQAVKGSAGNGNSVGVYLVGLPVAHIEIVRGAIHGFRGAPGAGNTQALQSGSSTDVKIYYNHIHDIDAPGSGTNENESHGVYLPGADVYVIGNLIEDIPNGYDVHFYGTPVAGNGCIVASNTLVNAKASGIVLPGDALGATIKNNILADHTGRGVDSFGIQFFPASSGAGSGNVIDRNLSFDNSGGSRSEAAPPGWTITNEATADPLFVGAGDYHLQAGSPAINAGDTAYQPAYDVDGAVRAAADLGAYAFAVEDPGDGTLALSDTATPTDTAARSVTKGIADAAAVADSVTAQIVTLLDLADAAAVADSLTAQIVTLLDLADTVAVADSVTTQEDPGEDLRDRLTVSRADTCDRQYVSYPFPFHCG